MGRPTKLNFETEQRILTALRAGNTRKAAAGYGGIDERTLERWMRRNVGFVGRIELAEAEAYVLVVTNLLRQIQAGDVRAMRFWLERRQPAEWGPPKAEQRVDLNVSGAGVHVYLPARSALPSNGSVDAADVADAD